MKYLESTALWTQIILVSAALTGCGRSQQDVWDDTKTCGRYMERGLCSLGGKQGDSRQVCSREDFYCENGDFDYCDASGDYFALADVNYPQARNLPGDPGSPVPGMEAFTDPSLQPALAAIFRNVHFEYDSPLVKGDANLQIIHNISSYLRNHPDTYVFIEGHCDERGPAAYNLALGSGRANTVRNMLIDEGVSPNNLFTISYGKERPLVMEHHEEAMKQNRRAEFKIYQR